MTMIKPITILIADDNKFIREAWKMILDADPRFTVIAECRNGEHAVNTTKEIGPDIVLMDINMHPLSGFEATKQICDKSPSSKVIGLSMHAVPEYANKMLEAGARGYVTKDCSKDELFTAILKVQDGGIYVSSML